MTFITKYKLLFSDSRFLKFGLFLTAINVLSGGFGYIYQILIGRVLQPTEFALFSSIMAFFMFLVAPTGALSMLIVRKASELKAHESLYLIKSIFFKINKTIFFIGILVLLLFWANQDYLQFYLKIEKNITIFIFSLLVIVSIFHTTCMAFLQGLQILTFLGIFSLMGVISKLLISIGLIKLGFGVEGALLGVLFSMLIIISLAIPVLFKALPPQHTYKNFRFSFSQLKQAVPVLIATISIASVTQLDMVIVNWYFSSYDAGLYAAASILGKAVLYLPGGLILALFPMVSEGHTKGKNSIELFQQAILVTIIFAGILAVLYWFFGELIISVLYGENYSGAGKILKWYGIAILPLTIVIMAEQYLIARGQVIFAWLFLFFLPLQLIAINIWHSNVLEIVFIMGFFGFLLAIIGCILIWRTAKQDCI